MPALIHRLTVIHDSGRRRIVTVEQAQQNHRLVVRWPSGAGVYTFDVVRNRMVRGVGWRFLECNTAREVWKEMRQEVKDRLGIGNTKIRPI